MWPGGGHLTSCCGSGSLLKAQPPGEAPLAPQPQDTLREGSELDLLLHLLEKFGGILLWGANTASLGKGVEEGSPLPEKESAGPREQGLELRGKYKRSHTARFGVAG